MLLLHALAWCVVAVGRSHGVELDVSLKEKVLTMEKEMIEIRSVYNKIITAATVSFSL